MSLDTKYRPRAFSDVLGQESTIRILRQFIAKGTGFHQSYLFSGPFGSGKTTLARILARGLLCESPTEAGDPCDSCPSCRSILEGGTHTDFVEIDAATNSGKAEIQRIVEEITFSTFGGRRRLYLFDESHQLSRDALDALLKPLEDNVPGSRDKRLVCIFCTTEPEKMRATIISRCAPVFVIRPLSPADIAKRLAYICDQEGVDYDPDMLPVIAEMTECHIRDSIKAIEGVSLLGGLSRENVTSYLHLDLNDTYLDALLAIEGDLGNALRFANDILKRVSPLTCYQRLSEMCLTAYKCGLGVKSFPAFWNRQKAEKLSSMGRRLLKYASVFSDRPGRPTPSMLECDLALLHYGGGLDLTPKVLPAPLNTNKIEDVKNAPGEALPDPSTCLVDKGEKTTPENGSSCDIDGRVTSNSSSTGDYSVVVDGRAVKKVGTPPPLSSQSRELDVDKFVWILGLRVAELDEGVRGPTGRTYMGRN